MEGKKGDIHLELDRIELLLELLHHPERDLRVIHIAGTNGKGSIVSYISTTLTYAGYRVGRYISPTLYDYLERFQVNGEMITEALYVELAEQIRTACLQMEAEGTPMPSPFELETVLAFLFFHHMNCDFCVLECGMGGKTDATNVIPAPLLAVFASISLDHTDFLGPTLTDIAAVKAGIIKEGCGCVISAPQVPEVEAVLRAAAAEKHVPIRFADLSEGEILSDTLEGQCFRYKKQRVETPLPGSCQFENALTAREALEALKSAAVCALNDAQIYEGMKQTVWRGRFTCIRKHPYFFVDGAHNPAAAEKLRRSCETYFAGRRKIFVTGMLKDKDYGTVVAEMAPLADLCFTMETPDNPRALQAEILAEEYRKHHILSRSCGTIKEAVCAALDAAGPEDVILAFGSLSFIGELTEEVQTLTAGI